MGEWNGTATTYPGLGAVAMPFCEAISFFVRSLSRGAPAERFLSLNAPKSKASEPQPYPIQTQFSWKLPLPPIRSDRTRDHHVFASCRAHTKSFSKADNPMAGASLFALLDDIATVLDDVAILTKVAAKKTAGVLGDDLALNAQQVAGVAADRELPVVWAVAKGSMINKAILVPAALGISAAAPWAVTPLLMLGGAYLCFEGVEKLFHKFFHAKEEAAHREVVLQVVSNPEIDMLAFEKDKVKGAIRTDFVLSA